MNRASETSTSLDKLAASFRPENGHFGAIITLTLGGNSEIEPKWIARPISSHNYANLQPVLVQKWPLRNHHYSYSWRKPGNRTEMDRAPHIFAQFRKLAASFRPQMPLLEPLFLFFSERTWKQNRNESRAPHLRSITQTCVQL